MNKLQTLSGFRDFLPGEKRKRDFVTKKIVAVFERFGFEPLETPTLEYASLLLGKYGTEADKLVYTFKDKSDREIGLRYDQTVPTARVLAQYRTDLPKYFRRYQIQNVFRAEKPQKGRFREFTQCDIDIFGSLDTLADSEILACTYQAFKNVGFKNVKLKINDRTVLFDALSQFATTEVSVYSIIQSIDKLDKKSEDEVIAELTHKGLTSSKAQEALSMIKIAKISENLQIIIDQTQRLGVVKNDILFTPALARGLDYYTGMIFEVIVPQYGVSSLGGGGRYDRLIEQLGGMNTPAVGIAFGFDRMVEAAEQLQLVTTESEQIRVLVTIFTKDLTNASISIVNQLRELDISAELFPNTSEKLDKQLKYADRKGIPYVAIIGPEEVKVNKIKLKNMRSRTEELISQENLITKLK